MLQKSKMMLPVLAVIVGVAASAFTAPHQSGKPYDTENYWYEYTGTQDATARTIDTNYRHPQMGEFSCNTGGDECAVQVTVTLDGQGNPPDNPDFTGASFDGSGFPEVNTGLIKGNQTKL